MNKIDYESLSIESKKLYDEVPDEENIILRKKETNKLEIDENMKAVKIQTEFDTEKNEEFKEEL